MHIYANHLIETVTNTRGEVVVHNQYDVLSSNSKVIHQTILDERLFGDDGSDRTWYLGDALGSVRTTLDDAGLPLAGARYDPWGAPQTAAIAPFGFTGELQQGDEVYLRARWYDSARGAFPGWRWFTHESRDLMPYSHHPYAYSLSNPTNYSDPTGKCAAPPMGSGNVVCISLFISAASIGPGGIGVGDGRSFSTNSAPPPSLQGGSRAYLYLYFDSSHRYKSSQSFVNRSYVLGGLYAFGPYLQYDQFAARNINEKVVADWDLLNGASGFMRSYRDTNIQAAGDSDSSFCAFYYLNEAVKFQAFEWLIGLDSIDGSMTIVYDRSRGKYTITSMSRDPYPSIEVYQYVDGKIVDTLYMKLETMLGPIVKTTELRKYVKVCQPFGSARGAVRRPAAGRVKTSSDPRIPASHRS